MNINDKLAKMAGQKGICEEWHDKLSSSANIEELMTLYYKGFDFCRKNDFPTLDFIRKHLKGKTEQFGGFVDDEAMSVEGLRYSVARGNTKGKAIYKDFNVARIFVLEDSEVRVVAGGNSFVLVDLYDRAKVSLTAIEDAKITVVQHGDQGKVTIISQNNKIKIIKK